MTTDLNADIGPITTTGLRHTPRRPSTRRATPRPSQPR